MTIEAQIQDMEVNGGDDIPIRCTVKDTAGAIVDISGASEIRYAMAATRAGPAYFIKTKSGGDLSFETDGSDGVFVGALTKAQTVSLAGGKHYHEAEITLGGDSSTVFKGTVTIDDSLLD